MTQKELAQKLGKTETEVSRWLSVTHNLTLSTICKISAALGEEIVIVPKLTLKPAAKCLTLCMVFNGMEQISITRRSLDDNDFFRTFIRRYTK